MRNQIKKSNKSKSNFRLILSRVRMAVLKEDRDIHTTNLSACPSQLNTVFR